MNPSRRSFLKKAGIAGAALAAPMIVPSSVFGADGAVSPSERINMAIIGYGSRGSGVMSVFLHEKDVQWIGVCDARAERREAGKAAVDRQYGPNNGCKMFADFRELLARRDLDAVYIATGCHWHALASIMAAKAGKDVFSEKPCTLTVTEGRALVDTCRRFGTVYQAGHQRRSVDSFRFMAEVVRSGRIGKVQRCIMQVWEGATLAPEAPKPVPAGFDYNMWLGWTPWHPYTNARTRGWAYFWDTGGGMMLDMGAHWTDMAQFVLQRDHTAPVEYEGSAEFPADAFSETPIRGEWRATYADGVQLVMRQTGGFDDRFIRFEGTDGWIQIMDGTNAVTAQPASILRLRDISRKGWGDAGDHVRNFLDCIKARNPMTTANVESAHRATMICHIGNICVRLGRKLRFDPATERFENDDEANRMTSRAMRPPWHL
jgi:predicted dehydrogenase